MHAWTLLVANLLRNKLRLCLMVLMIALAFCLLALFQATHHRLYANTGQQNNQKLIVLNKASASMALPLRYLAQISAIAGVGALGYGIYKLATRPKMPRPSAPSAVRGSVTTPTTNTHMARRRRRACVFGVSPRVGVSECVFVSLCVCECVCGCVCE